MLKAAPGLSTLTTENLAPLPNIGGYNLCYLRKGTNLAAVTVDEYKAPVIASWHAGAARVLCYTGQADGKFTGPMATWSKTGSLFTSMARWTAGDYESLPDGMLITQKLENGICEVTLHLDPEREGEPFSRAPVVTSLHDRPGTQPLAKQSRMQWTSPDSLSARLSVGGEETVLAGVSVPGVGEVTLPPQCMLYSPEYQPRDAGFGEAALQSVARVTGGKDRPDLTGIWKDLPRYPRMVPIGRWLLLTAIVLILLEVLQRHSGLLSAGLQRVSFQRLGKAAGKVAHAIQRPTRVPARRAARSADQPADLPSPQDQPAPTGDSQPTAKPSEPEAPKAEPESGGSVMDALDKARRSAKGRTQK